MQRPHRTETSPPTTNPGPTCRGNSAKNDILYDFRGITNELLFLSSVVDMIKTRARLEQGDIKDSNCYRQLLLNFMHSAQSIVCVCVRTEFVCTSCTFLSYY